MPMIVKSISGLGNKHPNPQVEKRKPVSPADIENKNTTQETQLDLAPWYKEHVIEIDTGNGPQNKDIGNPAPIVDLNKSQRLQKIIRNKKIKKDK